MYPSVTPTNFIEPSGNTKDGRRSSIDGMKDSVFVIEQQEMKKRKIFCEGNEVDRMVNIMNHVVIHNCSDYYLKRVRIPLTYDPTHYR